MRIAVYPGTFDPITNGHFDIVERAAALFDNVIVAVAENPQKKPLFSLPERRDLVSAVVAHIANVTVADFNGLLVDYAKSENACAIIRGLRAVSDFEFEFQMALTNRKLSPDLEMVYLMPSEQYTYINSTIVKEIARLDGDVDAFLPAAVVTALHKKLKKSG